MDNSTILELIGYLAAILGVYVKMSKDIAVLKKDQSDMDKLISENFSNDGERLKENQRQIEKIQTQLKAIEDKSDKNDKELRKDLSKLAVEIAKLK